MRAWLLLPLWLLTVLSAAVPPAQAQQAARPRVALVLGIGKLGDRVVLESAQRDSEAVAAALRAGGFEVLLRHDVSATELRTAAQQFRDKLRPETVGLIYYTGLAAQVDGRNLLLTSDVALADNQTGPAAAALLRAVGMPLQELADLLGSAADAPRALVVDAAYRHPVLARITPPGLARLRLPPGTMGLLGHAPAALQDVPVLEGTTGAVSRLAKVMVEALTTPRISMPEALRAVRLQVLDSSGGRTQPWVGGETFGREFLADARRLENPTTASPPAPRPPAAAASAVVVAAPPAPPASAASQPERRPTTDGRTAQAPGQGERPVYQARSNSFGHAEGDSLSYQVTDTRKDELLLSYTLSIDAVRNDGSLQANAGAWLADAQGRTRLQKFEDGAQSSYEPAQDLWWQRPQPGESRTVAFKESYVLADRSRGQVEWRGSAQVGTQRLLETPAGEFEVLPIKTTGQYTRTPESGPPSSGFFTRTVWFAAKLGLPVAVEVEDNDADGRPLRRERIELTHAQQLRSNN